MRTPGLRATRRVGGALGVIALMGVLATGVAFGAHFTDVGDSVHKENIEWLEDKGITVGCTATEYCPEEPVKRGQMATFIRRLAGQDPDVPPIVNAATLDGLESSDLLTPDEAQPGSSMTGVFGLADTATSAVDDHGAPISFPSPLSTSPTAHYIPPAGVAPAECSGSVDEPTAAPGHLCIYGSVQTNLTFNCTMGTSGCSETVMPGGTLVRFTSTESSDVLVFGTWAVTAPEAEAAG